MVFISKEKNYMFRPIVAVFRFWQFSAKIVLYNMPKPCGDVEISKLYGEVNSVKNTTIKYG